MIYTDLGFNRLIQKPLDYPTLNSRLSESEVDGFLEDGSITQSKLASNAQLPSSSTYGYTNLYVDNIYEKTANGKVNFQDAVNLGSNILYVDTIRDAGTTVLNLDTSIKTGDLGVGTINTWRIQGPGLFFDEGITGGGFDFSFTGPGMSFYSDIQPNTAAGYSLGNATYYWDDVSYKTLTDRGCLGSFDKGVEMPNGDRVSDLEVFQRIKEHPTKKTVYGVPRLDYKSLPKAVYKPADKDGKLLPRDENDQPYDMKDDKKIPAEDGAELTALVSIMIGAIKELTDRVEKLEKT